MLTEVDVISQLDSMCKYGIVKIVRSHYAIGK